MKKLCIVALLLSSTPLYATGKTETPPETPVTSTPNSSSQSAAAAAALAGAIAGSKSESNSDSNSGGNRIDASSRYKNRTLFIPPVVPPTLPSTIAVGNMIKETTACGPQMLVQSERVDGTFIGLFSKSRIAQGRNDTLVPYLDANGNREDYRRVDIERGGYRLYGHQFIIFSTVIGVASNRNVAIGGGSGGSWGQGGMGSSSANQQIVTNIIARECEIGSFYPQPEIVEVEVRKKRGRR